MLAVFLGVIEGLTEFLPVSSTAHLRITQALLGIDLKDGYWKMFSIVIQVGAILSLPLYFRARLVELLIQFPNGPRNNKTWLTHPLTLIAISFCFTAGPAFLLTKVIGKNLENLTVIGISLIVGGVVMWLVDIRYSSKGMYHTNSLDDATLWQAIWIGLCQILAPLFPGTSRSMATIAAGQVCGMSRVVALEFSFLVSIPTMVAATGYDLLKSLRPGHGENAIGATHIDGHGIVLLLIGGVVSFLVAYVVVAWFMQWVRKRGFAPFAVYRILAGGAVLLFMTR
jgi:undecaprenyl-diphosphatase